MSDFVPTIVTLVQTSVRKSIKLSEEELIELLKAYGRQEFDLPASASVTIEIDVSSQGFLRSVLIVGIHVEGRES